ncbi:MAG: hypothetical protein ACERLG_07635 [Sedimentibacter sp.]
MKRVVVGLIKFVITLCIFSAVFLVSVYLGYLYITPSSYVRLDCTPSVEFSLNTFDRVIKIKTGDEDTAGIGELKLYNMEITKAVQEAINVLASSGYISSNSSLIISVSNKDENKTSYLIGKLHEKIINDDENYEIQMVKMEYPLK